ncbi:hypothetical protein Q5P01_015758 [Channa striata]|uniref:Uncharacterized protein n=1 Tax=Channa striata TaxID=64152 RepID=A0AA88MC72_CHASR|nr:hypothetical protein Q5P01_015758 [Channa striata]
MSEAGTFTSPDLANESTEADTWHRDSQQKAAISLRSERSRCTRASGRGCSTTNGKCAINAVGELCTDCCESLSEDGLSEQLLG